MSKMSTRGLSLAYGSQPAVRPLDLALPTGQITALIGPNGSGKSTLLRGLAGLLMPETGDVFLDDRPLSALSDRQRARRLALLPQHPEGPGALTLRALLALARFPHRAGLWGRDGAGSAAIAQALEGTGLTALAHRRLGELSGGQRQRAWIAFCLAQQTDFLLLDEPTSALDPAQQIEVMQLIVRLQRERGLTVLVVLHDLNLAARYAQQLLLMAEGELLVRGDPWQVLTPHWLKRAFGVEVDVLKHPRFGVPLCLPWGLSAQTEPEG